MDLITKNSDFYISIIQKIEEAGTAIEALIANYHPPLHNERYLTGREVSQKLHISRRTLQEYRSNGQIAYCMAGGKILYRESDIEKWLTSNYQPAQKSI
jgi:excisionase family DNA binding protein